MYYDNKKLALSIFWVALGTLLAGLSIAGVLDSSIYSGMGGALIAVGTLQVIRNLRYRRDPAYREKIDTEYSDERNRFLRMKSWAWTGYIVVIAQAVGAVAAMIMGRRDLQLMLSYSVCFIMVVYLITLSVLNRKY